MRARFVVLLHPGIEIPLQLVDGAVDFLAERDAIELVEHGAMEAFADSIGLRALGLGTGVSPAQRTAFIELKWPHGQTGDGADLITRLQFKKAEDTLFDRFAGFFHAFGSLEKSVRQALAEKRAKDASYRLFGKKYDSLSTLLGRLPNVESGDAVDRYVIVLCATQLVKEVQIAFPEFWSKNPREGKTLSQEIANLTNMMREELIAQAPDNMNEFLSWFDRWFLERAHPLEVQGD